MRRSPGAYRSDKRNKELARRKKQEEKRKRRFERSAGAAQSSAAQEPTPPPAPEGETGAVPEPPTDTPLNS